MLLTTEKDATRLRLHETFIRNQNLDIYVLPLNIDFYNKEMFDQTFAAMDAMDNFRAKSIDAMGQNNAMMKEQLARADQYIDRTRQQQAREATKQAISGPVAL